MQCEVQEDKPYWWAKTIAQTLHLLTERKMVACHDLMILCNWEALKSCPLTSCLDPDWPLSLCCLRSLVKHTHTHTHTHTLADSHKDHLSVRFIYLIISQSENRLCRIFWRCERASHTCISTPTHSQTHNQLHPKLNTVFLNTVLLFTSYFGHR